jgi:hypothetical protein
MAEPTKTNSNEAPRSSRRGPRGNGARASWSLTAESFAKFLRWLSPDLDEAGRKYEKLRKGIVRILDGRGCCDSDQLFDRTIDRVVKKIDLGTVDCSRDPTAYCYGVARFMLHEYWGETRPDALPEDVPEASTDRPDWDEREVECLERCLDRLSARERYLITRYYQGQQRERIQARKELAAEVGGMNALRLQVFRLRRKLHNWVSEAVIKCDQRPK